MSNYSVIAKNLENYVPNNRDYKISFIDETGKRKITAYRGENKKSYYAADVRLLQVIYDPELYGNCCENDINFIKNDEEFIDIIVSEYDDYFIFNGDVVRAEMFIEKGDFRRDKFICLDESSDKPLFSGIILDFKRNEDLLNAYHNGIAFDLPAIKRYNQECVALEKNVEENKDFLRYDFDIDEEKEEILEKYEADIKKEVLGMVDVFFEKYSGAIEAFVQGLYFIVDSKIYYLTIDEYNEIYRRMNWYKFEIYTKPGLQQLRKSFLSKEIFKTIEEICHRKEAFLTEKDYVDLDNMEDIGTTSFDFVEKLLVNDEEAISLLESKLKKAEQKGSDSCKIKK